MRTTTDARDTIALGPVPFDYTAALDTAHIGLNPPRLRRAIFVVDRHAGTVRRAKAGPLRPTMTSR
ncbi:hypothetical protein [Streptomyces sp. NPDC091294]|uniref:hypothetical protein n=1 Tax=Streptomyces sp. NPDC091294 TaxID=3365992 RepID=UPI0038137529